MRIFLPMIMLAVASGLGGCNETMGGATAGPVVAAPITPERVAGDAPCAGEINAYRGVVAHDLDTGNVERKVYDQIQGEMARAASACSSGAGGQAHALVAASKARHGYRA